MMGFWGGFGGALKNIGGVAAKPFMGQQQQPQPPDNQLTPGGGMKLDESGQAVSSGIGPSDQMLQGRIGGRGMNLGAYPGIGNLARGMIGSMPGKGMMGNNLWNKLQANPMMQQWANTDANPEDMMRRINDPTNPRLMGLGPSPGMINRTNRVPAQPSTTPRIRAY
jgi:hypothetical protein